MRLWKVTLNEERQYRGMDNEAVVRGLVSLNIVAPDGIHAFEGAKALRHGQRFQESPHHDWYWPQSFLLWGLQELAEVHGP